MGFLYLSTYSIDKALTHTAHISRRIRARDEHAAVAKWYERGKVSHAKGAEICGVTRSDFIHILSQHQVSVIQYNEATLDQELS
ncbi:MAG: UPF0175 family protein [Candidatus Latescibacterota bacterium]|jgi:predicted HTH domain antitoxin